MRSSDAPASDACMWAKARPERICSRPPLHEARAFKCMCRCSMTRRRPCGRRALASRDEAIVSACRIRALLVVVQGSGHPSGELDARSLGIAQARLLAATEPVWRSASALPSAAHPAEGEVTSPGHRRPGTRFPHPAEQQPDVRGVAHTDLLSSNTLVEGRAGFRSDEFRQSAISLSLATRTGSQAPGRRARRTGPQDPLVPRRRAGASIGARPALLQSSGRGLQRSRPPDPFSAGACSRADSSKRHPGALPLCGEDPPALSKRSSDFAVHRRAAAHACWTLAISRCVGSWP
jgi:hypothetical protein